MNMSWARPIILHAARGYSLDFFQESFNRPETNDRMSYLQPKIKSTTNEHVFPLVADFNPMQTIVSGHRGPGA